MFPALKSIVIIFPILMGSILTCVGTLKLSEANLVSIEQWRTPYGLLVFSSAQLESIGFHVEIIMSRANLEKNLVPSQLELKFDLADQENLTEVQEEIVIGFQFPFKIADYQEFEISQRDIHPLTPVIIVENEIIIVEDEVGVTSLYYVKFKTVLSEWQHYNLLLKHEVR